MTTIAIVSQKGGVGKTTLAIHIAAAAHAAGYVTCLIDLDPQATAAAWGDWREGNAPEVITTPPTRLARTIQAAREAGAQVVVIDTPPNADAAAREAVRAADLILIPARPRVFDLHAVATTAALVEGFPAGKAWLVLNALPAGATRLMADAIQAVGAMGLRTCPVTLTERAPFHRAPAVGKVAMESDPTSKAAQEIAALWLWLCGHAHMPAQQQARKRAGGRGK